ncbi:unnamed protein product [Vitrella brassicaformis CCMP3155]|uniref:subtilisin n=2 Tax=Vitrella brassicaformis TaxID=1169539 RepID=A0A0G4G343_VITBC|nr:unnamed protein product [Vitrella brassicaformis CCMP3155]|eukprot:CEM22657.1 unnamed protein product [Vitrella brassicaformis CCMP3155]
MWLGCASLLLSLAALLIPQSEAQDVLTDLYIERNIGGRAKDTDRDEPSDVDRSYAHLVKSIPDTARRLFKPENVQLDTLLYQLHFLHIEQRLFDLRRQGVSAALARDDPFSSDHMRLPLGRSFQHWRGVFRDEGKLRRFARDTATQLSTDGIVVDMAIDESRLGWSGVDGLTMKLTSLGLTGIKQFKKVMSARLPFDKIAYVSSIPGIRVLRAAQMRVIPPGPSSRSSQELLPMDMTTRMLVGNTTSQGDISMQTDTVREKYGVSGSTLACIGVLSDSYNVRNNGTNAGLLKELGDLPEQIEVLEDLPADSGANDEGMGMMELMYDVAPGLKAFAFHTAFGGQAGFANGILALANQCEVVVDDVIYYSEPMFADGAIAQAIDEVHAMNKSYFSACGNNAESGTFEIFNKDPEPETIYKGIFESSYQFHIFNATDATYLPVNISVNSTAIIVMNYDQDYFSITENGTGAEADIDMFLYDENGTQILEYSTSGGNGDPIESLIFTNEGPYETFLLRLGKVAHKTPGDAVKADPNFIMLVYFGVSRDNDFIFGPSEYGHSNANGGCGVCAAEYQNTTAFGKFEVTKVNWYSSQGGAPIFFDPDGTRKAIPQIRESPYVCGPDGANTNLFPPREYMTPERDREGDGLPNFFGTSASAPHVAALAALIKDYNKDLTPDQIKKLLADTAQDMDDESTAHFDEKFDFKTGYGFVNGSAAFEELETLVTIATGSDDDYDEDRLRREAFDAVRRPNDRREEVLLEHMAHTQATGAGLVSVYSTTLREEDEYGGS